MNASPSQILVRSTLVGVGLGLALYATGITPNLGKGILINVIFSTVMWFGFEATHRWYQTRPNRPPQREAMRSMALISLIYTGLLAICVLLIRVLTGVNLVAFPAMAAMTFAIGFAVTNFIMAKYALTSLVEAEGAKVRAEARAGLLALQAQLQPHTLFNALNTIAALIPEDPKGAEEATERLSRLLRRIMEALERERWTLAEEFSVLEDLLALERLRFGSRLRTNLELDPAEAGRELPPLILLPLVENALKHGFRPKVGVCKLDVQAREGRIRVQDDGVGVNPKAPEGLGLRSVRERVEAEGGRLTWLATEGGCAVELSL